MITHLRPRPHRRPPHDQLRLQRHLYRLSSLPLLFKQQQHDAHQLLGQLLHGLGDGRDGGRVDAEQVVIVEGENAQLGDGLTARLFDDLQSALRKVVGGEEDRIEGSIGSEMLPDQVLGALGIGIGKGDTQDGHGQSGRRDRIGIAAAAV